MDPATTTDAIRNKLKVKHLQVREDLAKAHPKAVKKLKEKGLDLDKLREHSAKAVGTGALAGSLILASGSADTSLPSSGEVVERLRSDEADSDSSAINNASLESKLASIFNEFLPERTRPLSRNEEKFLESVIKDMTGIPAKASLEGEHLNTTYGRIGAEQHLKRYPGDSLGEHGEGDVIKEGIAPGLGAWGYFAPSKSEMTPDLVEKERWYSVVQTLYLPDWNTRQPYLKNWYKHRKLMIINTQNGKAVVTAIADSGPAAWTGKHYGGSPEVMDYLGGPRYKKGPVLVFFVDDPENKIPLGPVSYNEDKLVERLTN